MRRSGVTPARRSNERGIRAPVRRAIVGGIPLIGGVAVKRPTARRMTGDSGRAANRRGGSSDGDRLRDEPERESFAH